jgi:hypothetical protein
VPSAVRKIPKGVSRIVRVPVARGDAEPLEQLERLRRDERGDRAEHRHVDELPLAGRVADAQRGEDPDQPEERRDQVRERHADLDRRISTRAREHLDPGERLDHRVVRPVLADGYPRRPKPLTAQ